MPNDCTFLGAKWLHLLEVPNYCTFLRCKAVALSCGAKLYSTSRRSKTWHLKGAKLIFLKHSKKKTRMATAPKRVELEGWNQRHSHRNSKEHLLACSKSLNSKKYATLFCPQGYEMDNKHIKIFPPVYIKYLVIWWVIWNHIFRALASPGAEIQPNYVFFFMFFGF